MSLKLVQATPDKLVELSEVDRAAWGDDMAATREMLAIRMERYPPGNLAAIHEQSGRIAGSVWTVPIPDTSFATWMEASGNGVYDNRREDGPVLFGTNISVHRGVTTTDAVGPFLLAGALSHAGDSGRRFARTGARMPGYAKWSKLFGAEDYIQLYQAGPRMFYVDPAYQWVREGPKHYELLAIRDRDPHYVEPGEWQFAEALPPEAVPFDFELRFFCGVEVGGRRLKIKRLMPEYFEDPESLNNGVLLEWVNPNFA